jgi:hypothetical protein
MIEYTTAKTYQNGAVDIRCTIGDRFIGFLLRGLDGRYYYDHFSARSEFSQEMLQDLFHKLESLNQKVK